MHSKRDFENYVSATSVTMAVEGQVQMPRVILISVSVILHTSLLIVLHTLKPQVAL